MKCWTARMLIAALALDNTTDKLADIEAGKVEFNSQDIAPGDVFIALQGENGDGHDYIEDAIKRGAKVVIHQADQTIEASPDVILLPVKSTKNALEQLAQYKRKHSSAKFIAVTGSVGKTTTKEAMKLMLSRFGKVYANKSSFNNYLGVPLTLASIPLECDYVINEMGMNHAGELTELSNLAKPDIAIITNVSFSHAGNFNSVEAIADSKSEIFSGLDKLNGMIVLNKDCPYYARCKQNALDAALVNITSFGKQASGAELQFTLHELGKINCYRLDVAASNGNVSAKIEGIPPHLVANFAACLQVANLLKLDLEMAIAELAKFKPLLGRGQMIEISNDNGSFEVIADYYNASPTSVIAALCNLASQDTTKKVAVLGDMLELGALSADLHISLKEVINLQKLDDVILVGPEMHHLYKALQADNFSGRLLHYQNADSLCEVASELFTGGEVILIKGSRGMRLEKLAKSLGAEHVF